MTSRRLVSLTLKLCRQYKLEKTLAMMQGRKKGRKRHICVDTLGLLMCVVVHAACIQDRRGIKTLGLRLHKQFSSFQKIFVDGGYTGAPLACWFLTMFRWSIQVVKRTEKHAFVPLPKRWIVERTFGWMNWYRRLSKDYEYHTVYSEAQFKVANIRLMLKRL